MVQQLVKVLHAQRTQVASVLMQNYECRAECRLSFILEPLPLLPSIFVTFALAVARIFSALIVAFILRELSALEWHSLSCRLSVLISANDRWPCAWFGSCEIVWRQRRRVRSEYRRRIDAQPDTCGSARIISSDLVRHDAVTLWKLESEVSDRLTFCARYSMQVNPFRCQPIENDKNSVAHGRAVMQI